MEISFLESGIQNHFKRLVIKLQRYFEAVKLRGSIVKMISCFCFQVGYKLRHRRLLKIDADRFFTYVLRGSQFTKDCEAKAQEENFFHQNRLFVQKLVNSTV